jgi:hypothetical protein
MSSIINFHDILLSRLQQAEAEEIEIARQRHDDLVSMPADQRERLIKTAFWTEQEFSELTDLDSTIKEIKSRYISQRKALRQQFNYMEIYNVV